MVYPPQMYPQFIPLSAPARTTSQVVQLPNHQTYLRPSNQGILGTSQNKPADYQLLDERIIAIEGFSAYGMDTKNLCLVANVVLPQKFRVPNLPKYKGLSCPRSHVTIYCKKTASYINNDDLLIHCFQDNLYGDSLD